MVGLPYGFYCWMDFRGQPEMKRVGAVGNRTRYQSGAYVSTWESGRNVKLSGTAIIRLWILLPSQALWETGFSYKTWGGFCRIRILVIRKIDLQFGRPDSLQWSAPLLLKIRKRRSKVMKKRVLAVILGAAMMTAVLGGCGKDEKGSAESTAENTAAEET